MSEDEKPLTESQCQGNLKRTQYVWEMARHKTRIKQETKDRMRDDFYEAVLEYAAWITDAQYKAEKMKEYNDNQ